MNTLPLLPESGMDSIVAYRGAKPVTRSEFLHDLLALAARIPDTGHVLNLCKDRYWFAATLFASIARGTLTVLPNSVAPDIITSLWRDLPDLVCLGDQPSAPLELPYLQVSGSLEKSSADIPAVPRIPAGQVIMQVYTSGSTGKPNRHAKTFGRICRCIASGAGRLWAAAGGPCTVLGTVPFQHMYGLESTIFLPLIGGGRLTSRLPFFPADVSSALDQLPEPRLLVTTPFHLRKLLESGIDFPSVAAVVSATAPLSGELAAEAEDRLSAPIIEIYGSTETGQIATRRPTRCAEWEVYDGIELRQEQGAAIVSGGHLESPQILNDTIALCGPSRFRLIGRNSDMVNVVGKRSSLSYLNQIIASLPGVRDGVFCVPDTHPERNVSRLAAFVVAPGLCPHDIHSALLQQLDPVFLPRPVIFVESLPRDGNGKIPASALADLIDKHIP
ncbi:MAG: AMP-binding protein [Gammaproteobacteria bacterium]|nr:AMP-binding protein [Gammaproteobacteria bacterium]